MNLVASQNFFELKYKPMLNFFTNAGLNAAYVSTALNRIGFSAGLSLTWNIFDGRQRRITREKTSILKQSVSFYKNNFNVQNEVRKHKFLADLAAYNERRDNLQQQAAEYTRLLADYRKEIVQGQISIINYITVLKSMVLLKRDYFLAVTNSLLLVNGYNYWNW
jgi:outer membrane protein TolC